MKFLLLLPFLLILTFSNHSIAKGSTTERNLLSKERHGIRLHQKGKYKKSYKKLHDTAMWGLKDSQYYLGIMYLKGQYVEQDLIKGMGFIGVANEAGVKQRVEMFDNIYAHLSDFKKSQVDARVEEYIGEIGLKAKSMQCKTTEDVGSHFISRRKVVICNFYKRNIGGGKVE